MLVAEAERLQRAEEWGTAALSVNQRLFDLMPDDEAAAVRLARCYRGLGRLDEAAATLVRTLAAHADYHVARSQLKKTMRRRDARHRAEALLARGLTVLFAELEAAKRSERDHDFQVEGRRLIARRERSIEAACALGAAQRRAQDVDGAQNT
jgi:hypothetical protein